MLRRTLKDIFAIESAGNASTSACAACLYLSWAKLHISLALWMSHPSVRAICKPRIDPRALLDPVFCRFVTALCKFHMSSISSSLPLLPLESFQSSQSIINATSVTLKLWSISRRAALKCSTTNVSPKKAAQVRYFRASEGSSLMWEIRKLKSAGSEIFWFVMLCSIAAISYLYIPALAPNEDMQFKLTPNDLGPS